MSRELTGELRDHIAGILETIARDGLPGPRDLDVALDAIGCAISDAEDASPVPSMNKGIKTAGHTPVAWRVADCDEPALDSWSLDGDGSFDSRPIAAGDKLVCYVAGPITWGDEPSECDANAAFIVKACNSHEELVEALRELDSVIDFSQPWEPASDACKCVQHCNGGAEAWNKALRRARAALSKLESSTVASKGEGRN